MHPVKGTPVWGLFGATLGFFAGFAAVALFAPTAQLFRQAMDLSPARVGLLVAVPSLSGSLLRIPFAAWVDASGGRKPFLVLLSLSVAGMTGLYLVVRLNYPDDLANELYPLLLVLGVLSGCGIATFSVGISQVSYWFPQTRQGWALATYAGIGNLAPGLFVFLVAVALPLLGLAGSYLAWLAFVVAGIVLYALTGRDSPYFQLRAQGLSPEKARAAAAQYGQEIFPAGSVRDSLVLSARAWKTWALVILYFTGFGGFIALTAWLPTYWTSYFGASTLAAGILAGFFSILTSLARVFGGTLSDRMGGENTAMVALVTLFAGALIMTLSRNFELSVVGQTIMALGMGVTNAAVFKLVPQEVPQAVGGASGWVGGLGAFGGFVIPPALGAIVRSQGAAGYAQGFAIFAALALFSLTLTWMLKRSPTAQATFASAA